MIGGKVSITELVDTGKSAREFVCSVDHREHVSSNPAAPFASRVM